MKRMIYSMGILSVLLLTSCAEDTGTTTETVDSNANENVNPNHINDYEQPGTANSTASTDYVDAHYQRHALMTKKGNKQLQEATATQLVEYYYRGDLQPGLGGVENQMNDTKQLGGRTLEGEAAGQNNGGSSNNGSSNQNSGNNNTTTSKDAATKQQQ